MKTRKFPKTRNSSLQAAHRKFGRSRAAAVIASGIMASSAFAATLTVDSAELPWLYQWRLFREREYVLALEPATADAIEGRAAARARGAVPVLAPGEVRTTSLTIGFDHRW